MSASVESETITASPPQPAASVRGRVARNAVWNWTGMVVEAVVGFLLAPILIHRLGDESYGVWILIGSLTGYVGLLDFGMRGSVGRFVAFYHARGDHRGLLRTLNTATAILAAVACVAFAIIAGISAALPNVVDIPLHQQADAQAAFLIMGAQLGLFLLLRSADATLWGLHRFDLLNIIDIPVAILRGGLCVALVTLSYGLVELAWLTFAVTLISGGAKFLLCRRELPFLRFRREHVARANFRELTGYGFWNFLISTTAMLSSQLGPLVVSSVLGLIFVTPYAIAMRLNQYASMLLMAITGVMTPLATALHAQDDLHRQRRLFLETGKLCVLSTLLAFVHFLILGPAFLTLWLGPRFAGVWLPLIIVATGELLPKSVSMSSNTILGMARHRAVAWRGVAEGLIGLGGGTLLALRFGLPGFCTALAVGAFSIRGVYILIYTSKLLGLSPAAFFRECAWPLVRAIILPSIALFAAARYSSPDNWPQLVAYSFLFTAATLLFSALSLFGPERALSRARQLLRRIAPHSL